MGSPFIFKTKGYDAPFSSYAQLWKASATNFSTKFGEQIMFFDISQMAYSNNLKFGMMFGPLKSDIDSDQLCNPLAEVKGSFFTQN